MKIPDLPSDLDVNPDGIPVLRVYMHETDETEKMDIETYLCGVVAGEMKGDWPLEALKAQAILARTFTMNYLSSGKSSRSGADISTDVTEAQAYNAGKINSRIRQAVTETSGTVMIYDGEFPRAWFHAHSGGSTELPTAALDYKQNDPEYLYVTASYDSEKAPADVKSWEASFTAQEVGEACAACGVETGVCRTIQTGDKGRSGRAKTLVVNGREVSAPSFRINLGANKLKSTLIDSVSVSDGVVTFSGRGFGHGVGMSQWGAYGLAEEGAAAQAIVAHYFRGVEFADLW